ncbi:GNAT family N-acetyltransferase [Candidatus Magnetobacterium casense]|uniref:GNAT family N-acetyltransferase n=1 Tax=Candidatus Magnetobacterium casense TaxID=1455061 RepID=UPI0006983553|nr:GNAT family N-acetyltransferase [Candidatus Magnetobacterium casensis]
MTDFLINQSKLYLNQLLAVTYILESKDETIAFYSVLNDKVQRSTKINKNVPNKKRYYTYPAVKIGRLGVHKNYQCNGIGTKLLYHVKRTFRYDNKTGCRFLTVDAYNKPDVLNFYIQNRFAFFSENDKNDATRLLFYDLIDIAPMPE